MLAAVPALALVAVLFVLSRPAQLVALSEWAMERFAGLRLVLVDPDIATYEGRLAARELHLVPPGSAPLLSLYHIDASTRLQDVLSLNLENSEVKAAGAVLYLPEQEADENTAGAADALSYLGFLPQISSLVVVISCWRENPAGWWSWMVHPGPGEAAKVICWRALPFMRGHPCYWNST